jgi:hypothetical protein
MTTLRLLTDDSCTKLLTPRRAILDLKRQIGNESWHRSGVNLRAQDAGKMQAEFGSAARSTRSDPSRRSVMFQKLAIALATTTIAFCAPSFQTAASARGLGGGGHFGAGGAHFGGGGVRYGGGVARFGGGVARFDGGRGYYGGRYYGGRRFGYGVGALGLGIGLGYLEYGYSNCYVWTPYGCVNQCGYGYNYYW